MAIERARLTMDVIAGRRSVRKLRPDAIADDVLVAVLEAGRLAPSGRNEQPWKFIVVRDPPTIEKIGRLSVEGAGRRGAGSAVMNEIERRFEGISDPEKRRAVIRRLTSGAFHGFVGKAPAVIVVCGRKDAWDLPYDLAAATENMLLMAHALGLGACWVLAPCADVRDEIRLRRMLGIPDDYKVSAIITLGYPEYEPKPRPRKPLNETAYEGRFGSPLGTHTLPDDDCCGGERPKESAHTRSVLEAIACDLEAAFYDEHGMGTRHRVLLAGTGYLASRYADVPSGSDIWAALEAARTVLEAEGIVGLGQLEWTLGNDGVVRLSVPGCGFRGIHEWMVSSGRRVCCCPVGNAVMWFMDRALEGHSELAGIEVTERECRVILLKRASQRS